MTWRCSGISHPLYYSILSKERPALLAFKEVIKGGVSMCVCVHYSTLISYIKCAIFPWNQRISNSHFSPPLISVFAKLLCTLVSISYFLTFFQTLVPCVHVKTLIISFFTSSQVFYHIVRQKFMSGQKKFFFQLYISKIYISLFEHASKSTTRSARADLSFCRQRVRWNRTTCSWNV